MSSFDVRRIVRPAVLTVMVILAGIVILHLWNYYHAEPWTRDGRVRGDVIQVSSDVAGLVTKVYVQDNQTVKKGDRLFSLDTERQKLNVEQAKSDVIKAQAGLAQAEASLAQAQATFLKAKTNIQFAEKDAARYRQLMDGAISKQERDRIFASRDQAHAEQEQAKATIAQAQANIKQQKSLVDVAQNQVHLAELNMNRSEILAPANGTLSNFAVQVGDYIQIGQPITAMIDRRQLYVVGYFEETKLNRIHIGDQAEIELMGDNQKLYGHVQGIALGIEDRERTSSSSLLANVNPTFTWVRLAQRVPVKIVLDKIPENSISFVAGRTATVQILDQNKR